MDEKELVDFYYEVYALPEISLRNPEPDVVADKPSMAHNAIDSVSANVRFDVEELPKVDETLRLGSLEFPISPFSVDKGGFFVTVNLSPTTAPDLLKTYKQRISSIVVSINSAVQSGNADFRTKIANEVHLRKEKLASQAAVLEKLSTIIPLKLKPESSSPIVPLQKKKQIEINPPKPKLMIQPRISPKILNEILDVLIRGGRMFESTPVTFSKLGEVDLRNILLSILNGNFEEAHAKGEAFHKLGKTDISLLYSGDNVFVAECKYWDGAGVYSGTITQLFRYLTFRENLGVIICFSTEKDFSKILENCKKAIREHESFVPNSLREIDANGHFTSKHLHVDDKSKTTDIHHLIFTLYFDKSSVGLEDN